MTKQPPMILITTIGVISIFSLGIFIGSLNFKAFTPPHWVSLISVIVALFVFFGTQYLNKIREIDVKKREKKESIYLAFTKIREAKSKIHLVDTTLYNLRDPAKKEDSLEVIKAEYLLIQALVKLYFPNKLLTADNADLDKAYRSYVRKVEESLQPHHTTMYSFDSVSFSEKLEQMVEKVISQ
ncbi:hypothetical protein FCV53_15500 [Vibrio sp. F12]|uniref:hypothetical protein n=1 Tax=Vibrio sp. F12 TaxID=2070776 RepID=UPI0010BDD8D8|nr:hypothetical protein [Vibrio sp. F12]TKE90280.1 hypothetical protein FCV53_15500 [Vibrio sp. F12]